MKGLTGSRERAEITVDSLIGAGNDKVARKCR